MNYQDPTLRARLAEEYVLGTLQGAACQRFERLLRHDAILRDTVQEAAQRWNVLVETLPPIQPSAAVWRNIERRIAPVRQMPERPWRRLGFWRGWALVTSAFAAMLILYIGVAPLPVTYVVVITMVMSASMTLASLRNCLDGVREMPTTIQWRISTATVASTILI
jgi:anti-sigma-K factor RskA